MVGEGRVSFVISADGVKIESANDMSTLLSQAPELAVAARIVQSMNGGFSVEKEQEQAIIKIALQPMSETSDKTLAD